MQGSVGDINPALRGWLVLQRARLAHKRHPGRGEISPYCLYATKLRFGNLAFDIGANRGDHTKLMLARGAKVVALEPQPSLAAQLAQRLTNATVLAMAAGDAPGQAELHLAAGRDDVASLEASWANHCDVPLTWENSVQVPVTTVDRLIHDHGEPTLLKIDTEGFEDRVLRGLSRPVEHILFEVHASIPHVASSAFERLGELGHYEYSMMWPQSWQFHRERQRAGEILADLPVLGDVYAHRIG